MEIWKKIEGFEDYEVSTSGVVISNKYSKKRILKKELSKGYLRVSLCKKNVVTRFQVHRLVALSFLKNEDNKKCVNHKDGNKLNNSLGNLEWCTYSENEKHSFDFLGKITNGIVRRKIPLQDVEKIKNLYKNGLSMRKIAKQYNVNGSTISLLINNKTYVKWI